MYIYIYVYMLHMITESQSKLLLSSQVLLTNPHALESEMPSCTDKFTGLPMPVVLHVRSAYEYCERDGVRHYTQDHMCDPGDPNPNECSFLARGAILKGRSVARSTGVGRK